MELGISEIRELIELLNQSDLSELSLETGDVKLSLKKGPAGAPLAATISPGMVAQGMVAPASVPAGTPQLAITYAQSPAPASVPAGAGAGEGAAASAPAAADRPNVYLIRSPMVGTFYRAPSPDASAFAEVGQTVEPGQTVCIIEAMKLMNEIESEHGGKVIKICVGNGEAVEFGQVLLEIER
jgi:acetyl-CoA carboxylase biotin carboxyl carrier protein